MTCNCIQCQGMDDPEVVAFGMLKGKFKHYCPDWDGMAIDETCPEFENCTCPKSWEEALPHSPNN